MGFFFLFSRFDFARGHELYVSLQTLLDCLFAGLVETVGCYMWEYAIKNTKSKQKKIIVRIQNSWGSASIFFLNDKRTEKKKDKNGYSRALGVVVRLIPARYI